MNQNLWSTVDRYLTDLFLPPDSILETVITSAEAAGLPPHQVAPNQGKLLYLLAKAIRSQNVLEIGTLAGYSTIWLGRAVGPEGRVVSLEANPQYAELARANIVEAGLAEIVEVRTGPALETLPKLAVESSNPFDLVFLDADKPNNPGYLEWALKLTRPGSLIIADNVIRNGAVADPDSDDPNVLGIRHFHEMIAGNPRLSATALQTVGSKGYDGFTLALVLDNPEIAE